MTEQNNTSGNRWKLFASWAVLLLFLVAVEHWVGWAKVLEPWTHFSLLQGLVALALLVLSYALRAWRMYDYFPQQLAGQWFATWRLMLIHNVLNNLLPARTGEASFPLLMKRYFGVNYAHSVSALLWFRLLDLHAILTFAVFPLLMLSPLKRFATPLLLCWFVLPMMVFLLHKRIELWFAGKDGKLSQIAQQAMYGLPDNWSEFWRSWAMTWANWLVKLLTIAWLLQQFVPGASWNLLLTSVVGGELTSVLPIHAPGGFGTYEAGIIAPLSRIVDMDTATIGAVNAHLFILGSSMIGGLVGWLIPIKEQQQAFKQ